MAVSVIIHPLLTVITVVDVISIPFVRNLTVRNFDPASTARSMVDTSKSQTLSSV